MMNAINTTIDPSAVARLRVLARARDRMSADGLSILRRLEKQFLFGQLPRQSEQSVEQSWNEQVFCRLFGYTSLLATDTEHNLKAKNNQGGYFSDFSLGFFTAGRDDTIVTAELKGPAADLDKPQGAKYHNETPVQQAFRTARRAPSCRWVIVSNFIELRLYPINDETTPLLQANLTAVYTLLDLATLTGVLCPESLLGSRKRLAELSPMSNDDPGSPVAAKDGSHRLAMRFVPKPLRELPLFRIEQRLRNLVPAVACAPRLLQVLHGWRFKNGWLTIDTVDNLNGNLLRIDASTLGEVLVSARFEGKESVDLGWVLIALRFFQGLVTQYHNLGAIDGIYMAELREIDEKKSRAPEGTYDPEKFSFGTATSSNILAGDFAWRCADGTTPESIVINCLCELAAHFRHRTGGIALDDNRILNFMRERDIDDRRLPRPSIA